MQTKYSLPLPSSQQGAASGPSPQLYRAALPSLLSFPIEETERAGVFLPSLLLPGMQTCCLWRPGGVPGQKAESVTETLTLPALILSLGCLHRSQQLPPRGPAMSVCSGHCCVDSPLCSRKSIVNTYLISLNNSSPICKTGAVRRTLQVMCTHT